MTTKEIARITLGDMEAVYTLRDEICSLMLLPKNESLQFQEKELKPDNLVQ